MWLLLLNAGCGSLIVTQQSVDDLAGRRGFTWNTSEIDGFVIYVEPDSVAEDDLQAIESDALSARRRVLAYLEEPTYERTVSIFVVDTLDRMEALVGRRSNATGYHTSDAICLVWGETRRVGATHELLHVVAMNRWGVPERWINEGMAVDASGPWLGLDVDAVCKHLRSRDELPSLKDITQRFGRLPPLASYPAAGSFVRFLRETYGLDTVRIVWNGGRRSLTTATGTRLEALEAAWLERVDGADATGIEYEL
jgi:hypothetical protein